MRIEIESQLSLLQFSLLPAEFAFATKVALKGMLGVDPLLPNFLIEPPAHQDLANLHSVSGSGIAIGVVPDPLFYLDVNGAQVLTVFRMGIKNETQVSETLDLSFLSASAGFVARASVNRITILPGVTAEVGLIFTPATGLPAPGTVAPFTIQATSVNDPAVTVSMTSSFVVPVTHGVTLMASPRQIATIPGLAGDVAFQISSTGNVSEHVTFQVQLPVGLTLTGLTDVTLTAGETRTLMLTVTPAAGLPINTQLTATITADFGNETAVAITIPFCVVVPGADAMTNASAAAGELGDIDFANRLSDLSIALTNLVQTPDNPVFTRVRRWRVSTVS